VLPRGLVRCSGCTNPRALYCGRQCQSKDWTSHKQLCLVSSAPVPPGVELAASALAGIGLRASRAFREGEVVFEEKRFLTVSKENQKATSMDALNARVKGCLRALSVKEQRDFDRLHNADTRQGACREVSILSSNCAGTSDGSSLFLFYSRLNHSCAANVQCTWIDRVQRMRVVAVRSICAGEELVQDYTGTATMFWSREQRQSFLREQYGFICSCAVCVLQGLALMQSDLSREQMREERPILARLLRRSEWSRAQAYAESMCDTLGRMRQEERVACPGAESTVSFNAYRAAYHRGDLAVTTRWCRLALKHALIDSGQDDTTPLVMYIRALLAQLDAGVLPPEEPRDAMQEGDESEDDCLSD